MVESGFYKFNLDPAPTVNEVGSTKFNLDTQKGRSFYVEKLWIAAPDLDAIAAADQVAFQLSKKSQNDEATLYDIENDQEIMTEFLDFHLAEAALTNLKDPSKEVELENFRGLMLPKEFYMNHLITGQDAAIGMYVKIKGNYSDKELDSDYHNRTL